MASRHLQAQDKFVEIVCGFCGGGLALTCLEWDFGSGGLKNESGSFLILIGTEGGMMVFFGFITALNRASRSVSESPRTWTICWPAGGLCWLGSMTPDKT